MHLMVTSHLVDLVITDTGFIYIQREREIDRERYYMFEVHIYVCYKNNYGPKN